MLESLLIALIVAAAALYAVWALAPASLRKRIAMRLVRLLGGADSPGMRGSVARALQGLANSSGGGCSDCSAAKLHQPPAGRRSRRD